MKKLIDRLGDRVKGIITGFDRIVFKGNILPLMHAAGAMRFCAYKNILNKDYKTWMMTQSESLSAAVDQYAKKNCGQGIIALSTWRIRKEEMAHDRQKNEGIQNGLIGVWSCLENATSYRSQFNSEKGFPQLKKYQTRCKHLYLYFDHPIYGFMSIRIQTWFPYPIQISLNGREWLRRCLEKEQINFVSRGNKFFHIDNYAIAQQFLNQQLDTRFVDMLDAFLPVAFPIIQDIFGNRSPYYWTLWQSEVATDIILSSPDDLTCTMDSLLRYAHMTGTSSTVLRYLDRPLTSSGKPYIKTDDVVTRVLDFQDGIRVRHWVGNNSVKVYNEQNNLRIECTMNDPNAFRVMRFKQGQNSNEEKSRLPLRKGISDIPIRATISQDINNRMMNHLADFHDDKPAEQVIEKVTQTQKHANRKFRALDPIGKDRELLRLIALPEFRISGFANKMLRKKIKEMGMWVNLTDKQISAKISRYFQLLRTHGVIRKLPKQNRYLLTQNGAQLTCLINAFLAASTEQLFKLAA